MTLRKFTTDRQAAILAAMRAGAGYPRACVIAGVSAMTGRNWRHQAAREGEDSELGQFFAEVEAIVADRVARAERVMFAAVDSADEKVALKASQFVLERLAPDEYGSRNTTELLVPQQALPRVHEGTPTRLLEAQLEEMEQ